MENEIQQCNNSLLYCENRISELINNQSDTITAICILGIKLDKKDN